MSFSVARQTEIIATFDTLPNAIPSFTFHAHGIRTGQSEIAVALLLAFGVRPRETSVAVRIVTLQALPCRSSLLTHDTIDHPNAGSRLEDMRR